jgi:hypothetical protein
VSDAPDERDGRRDRDGPGERDGRREGDEREEYAGWSRPGADEAGAGSDGADATDEDEEWGPPPTIREPLLRDRVRDRLGLGARQWFVLETVLLAAPYPLFVLVYLLFDVNETLFLAVTLVYSLAAMYFGLLS